MEKRWAFSTLLFLFVFAITVNGFAVTGEQQAAPATPAVAAPAATPAAGPMFWISDTGVRYGVNTEDGDAVAALGLSEPALTIPWSVLSQFALGPTLSRSDALLAHDGLAPDPRPGRRASAELGAVSGGGAR